MNFWRQHGYLSVKTKYFHNKAAAQDMLPKGISINEYGQKNNRIETAMKFYINVNLSTGYSFVMTEGETQFATFTFTWLD